MALKPPGPPTVQFPHKPRDIQQFGYSFQSHIVIEVYSEVFGRDHWWVWFSTRFHPARNDPSANPARLFSELSEIVQRNDVPHKTLVGNRASLLATIAKHVSDPGRAALLRDRVVYAPVEFFRPQIWLLDLELIAKSRGQTIGEALALFRRNAEEFAFARPGQTLQEDEYLIKDAGLRLPVIIDGEWELDQRNPYYLLSNLYALLWGELDDLSDEHRWTRMVSDKEPVRYPENILSEIRDLSLTASLPMPVPINEIEADYSEFKRFYGQWSEAYVKSYNVVRRQLMQLKSNFEEKLLQFAVASTRGVGAVIVVRVEMGRARKIIEAIRNLPGIRACTIFQCLSRFSLLRKQETKYC